MRPYSAQQLRDKIRSFLSEDAVPKSSEIRIDAKVNLQLAKISCYLSGLEQASAIVELTEKGLGYHAYPILRSQMEGVADLINLENSPSYIQHLELQYEESFQKYRVSAKKGNPYFAQIASLPSLSSDISGAHVRIERLKRRGARCIELKEKMKKAGLQAEYESLFPVLNDHTHGGIKAWATRHVRETETGFEIAVFRDDLGERFIPLFLTSWDALTRSSQIIHRSFDTGHAEYFLGLIER